jgi:hypothetical protein
MSDSVPSTTSTTTSPNSGTIDEYQKWSELMFQDQLEVAKIQATQAVHQTTAQALGQSGR